MNAPSSTFSDLVKEEAQNLHLALTFALHPTDSLNQFEPSFKVPTSQQCNEIIAQAYGFNTFNGTLQNQKSDENQFKSERLNESLRLFLLRENTKESTGLFNLVDVTRTTDFLDSIVIYVKQLYTLINGYPSLHNFKLPKYFHANEYKFDWHMTDKSPFINKGMEAAFNLFLSLLIENLDSVETFESNNSSTVIAPINIFYKHQISNIYGVKDIVIDLEDLLNSSGILSVSSGLLDFIEHNKSNIEIEMSTNLLKNIQMIARWNKNKEAALSKLDSVLDIYVRHYGVAFQSIFKFACLEQSPQKRLTGNDLLKYQLNKRFYFSILLEHIKLPQNEVHACTHEIDGMTSISAVDQKLIFESVYFNDAITIFDDRYAKQILPFVDKYIQQQKELISAIKPYLKDLAGNGPSCLPTELQLMLEKIHTERNKFRGYLD